MLQQLSVAYPNTVQEQLAHCSALKVNMHFEIICICFFSEFYVERGF